MFAGFEASTVAVKETTVFYRRKGTGPPVLLLHGFPETHLMWHAVAETLAAKYTVICPDLRGYGASGRPASGDNPGAYAKSAMARDLVELMAALGFDRYSVVGHDRGGRVAYRMALNHAASVERLAVLDIVPTGEAFRRADARFALSYWPWVLLSQPAPLPERLIASDPEAVVDDALSNWGSQASSFSAEIRAAYVVALSDPAAVSAICEEFRAAATLDVAADEADRHAGRQIHCPVLVLWGAEGPLDTWYDAAGGPLGIWRTWAPRATGRAIAGGHFFPEENPAETLTELHAFLERSDP